MWTSLVRIYKEENNKTASLISLIPYHLSQLINFDYAAKIFLILKKGLMFFLRSDVHNFSRKERNRETNE